MDLPGRFEIKIGARPARAAPLSSLRPPSLGAGNRPSGGPARTSTSAEAGDSSPAPRAWSARTTKAGGGDPPNADAATSTRPQTAGGTHTAATRARATSEIGGRGGRPSPARAAPSPPNFMRCCIPRSSARPPQGRMCDARRRRGAARGVRRRPENAATSTRHRGGGAPPRSPPPRRVS